MATAPAYSPPLYGKRLVDYIEAHAASFGLESRSLLAVITHEGGLYGAVGDSGTSFGPFQLHRGGALPSGVQNPRLWAQSSTGVDYALSQIATVAGGESGAQAIHDIVYRFERPSDPGAETAKAELTYAGSPQTGALFPGVGKALTHLPGGGVLFGDTGPKAVGSAVEGIVPGLKAADRLVNFVLSYRFLEVLGGGLLLLLGLYLLGRKLGASVPVPAPAPVRAAAKAVPAYDWSV